MEDDRELSRVRRRIMTGLFAASGLASIPTFAAFTIANVLGAELLRAETWSGLPGTFILLGSAVSAAGLSNYMSKFGRRRGLIAGYVVGALGSGLAVASTAAHSFGLLVVGMVLFGFAGTSIQLSRYAAADVHSIEGRAKAISLITWASVIGALIGPNLVGPSGRLAEFLQLPSLAGPFLLCAAGLVVSAGVVGARLRPDPLEVARSLVAGAPYKPTTAESRTSLFASARVQIAIAAITIGQLVMVLVMSMTAVHMRGHDHTWGTVGFVISAHLMGMFALSPVSGWASDRFGRLPVIVAGAITLISATLLSAGQPDNSAILTVALFLLGFGWNLGNVAGSALLTDAVPQRERARMQGMVELVASMTSAVAGLVSGLILGALGFANLSVIGTLLIVVLLFIVAARRRGLLTVPEAPAA